MPFEMKLFFFLIWSTLNGKKNGLPNSGPFYDVTSSTLKHTLLFQSGLIDTDDVRPFISCPVPEFKLYYAVSYFGDFIYTANSSK